MDIPRGWVLAALTAEAWLTVFVLLAFAGWLSAALAWLRDIVTYVG